MLRNKPEAAKDLSWVKHATSPLREIYHSNDELTNILHYSTTENLPFVFDFDEYMICDSNLFWPSGMF